MSEEKVLEILTDLCTALEAAAIDAKRRIAELTGVEEAPVAKEWDPSRIKWEQAEGAKGPFERSDDVNNRDFKALVKDLAAHGGRLTHEGFFYWLYKNGATVGRKRRGKAKPKTEVDATAAIKTKFPDDLAKLLIFDTEGDFIVMKPREYLGSETFAKIAAIVREAGGEYVSAGKASHFRIKK